MKRIGRKRQESLALELDEGVPIETLDTLLSASDFFRLGRKDAESQLARIRAAVRCWRDVAKHLGIARREQEEMASCFARADV